jgi:protein TonB
MFDYATTRPAQRMDSSRVATATISLAVHVGVIVAIVVPALFATSALPTPPAMMAFVAEAVPPPPPPPTPPPPAQEIKKQTPTASKTRQITPVEQRISPPVPPAPTEAPTGISEETGLETNAGATSTVAAGFEGGIPGTIAGGVIGGIERVLPPAPPPPVRTLKPAVRVGGQLTPPRLIHRVPPEYPLAAQHAQIEGIVILEATVDTDGHVESVRVLRSHSVLDRAAMDAVSQWEYEPLVLNGEPFPFVLTVTVSFHLDRTR